MGAAISLALFGLCVLWLGIGYHLLAVAVPFGLLSILLAYSRRRSIQISQSEWALFPFSSVSEILTVRRSVGGFTKHRYPDYLKSKRIRDPLIEQLLEILQYALWLVFSPLVLLFQLLPETECLHEICRESPTEEGLVSRSGAT